MSGETGASDALGSAAWGDCPSETCAGVLVHDPRGAAVWPRQLVSQSKDGDPCALVLESTHANDKAGVDLVCAVCDEGYTEVIRSRRRS